MFRELAAAPKDPILGLTELYRADKRDNKINLSVGVYQDENGHTPILESVKKAEAFLLENENSKIYLPIEGSNLFNQATQQFLLGEHCPLINEGHIKTAQTLGGTGALRVIADFLYHKTNTRRVWLSQPTWPNHHNIFNMAGLEIQQYRYYDPTTHLLDFESLIDDLNQVPAGDAVLFHACCHNPTGVDPTPEQWKVISDLALEKGWLPIFDSAYQGFGLSLDEDAFAVRLFAEMQPTLLIANSFSKNFGLYNERVGAVTLITKDTVQIENAFSQLKATIRANYSSPPYHGANIVAYILSHPELKEEWQHELATMRQRIHRMRQLFVKTLQDKGASKDISFIAQQNGMFSFSGLTEDQVLILRNDYGIYMVNSGRLNIAGMTLDNMSRICESILKTVS